VRKGLPELICAGDQDFLHCGLAGENALAHRRFALIQRRVADRKLELLQALFDGIQRVLTGQQDPQAAMDQANDEIQALLDS